MEANNMAARREALEELKSEAEHGYEVFDYPVAGAPGERGTGHYVEADYIIDTVKAALSKPPRNCDRFKTADEAWNAYDEWVESFRVNRRMPPYNVFGWLFAPAAELKGDGDGK